MWGVKMATRKSNVERRAIDKVLVLLGATATVFLLIVGGLTWHGYKFATGMVRDNLTEQKIFFPPAGSAALPSSEYPDLQKYGGKQVVDGDMAKAYADGFIKHHLEKIAGGKTYAEVSSAAMADPTNSALQGQKAALFQGETLRGILLGTGYAYWTFGVIAKWIALASFLSAAIMALLTLMGLGHIGMIKSRR